MDTDDRLCRTCTEERESIEHMKKWKEIGSRSYIDTKKNTHNYFKYFITLWYVIYMFDYGPSSRIVSHDFFHLHHLTWQMMEIQEYNF